MTFQEDFYTQVIKFGVDAGVASTVYPSAMIDVSRFTRFAVIAHVKAGDVGQIKLVQAADAAGTNTKDLSEVVDLSAETLTDGQRVIFDAETACLDTCGFSYIGAEMVAVDISGDIIFIGYGSRQKPVEPFVSPDIARIGCCECC